MLTTRLAVSLRSLQIVPTGVLRAFSGLLRYQDPQVGSVEVRGCVEQHRIGHVQRGRGDG